MTSQQILDDIRKEINYLIQTYGVETIEFSLTTTPASIVSVAKIKGKTTVWYENSHLSAFEIYKKITNEFVLTYDENLRGQYLYIVLNI